MLFCLKINIILKLALPWIAQFCIVAFFCILIFRSKNLQCLKTTAKCLEVWSLYEIKWRHYFTDDTSVAPIPDLLEVQLDSYRTFLEKWIDEAFKEVFPINDFSWERIDIYYKWYFLEEPKYDAESCKRKNLNYEAPLKVRLEMLTKKLEKLKNKTFI